MPMLMTTPDQPTPFRGGRGSLSRKTPLAIWDDGIHFVRPASDDDKHPLRWVISAHRAAPSKYSRRIGTREEAIELASDATKRTLASDASAKRFLIDMSTPSPTSSNVDSGPKLPPFSTTHFNCIRANPVAQVWQCFAFIGEKKPVGRKAKGYKQPKQTPFKHAKGECAVLMGDVPVIDLQGEVRVFRTWQEAEQYALDLYEDADPDSHIGWQAPEGRRVGATPTYDVIFDPAVNGISKPFSLYSPQWNKPVYIKNQPDSYAVAGQMVGGGTFQPRDRDGQDALDFNRKVNGMGAGERISMEVKKFRSIVTAERHALDIDPKVEKYI